MEAIGKNIDSYGSKRNLIEVENNGKPSLASNRKSSFSFVVQWLFFVAVTCLTLFFIAIVVKQEYEIKAIQLGMGRSSESDDFQRGDNMVSTLIVIRNNGLSHCQINIRSAK